MATAAKRSSNKTKSVKAHGRSLSDFEPLTPAEKMLHEACLMGEIALISEGEQPKEKTDNNRVRSSFVRFLAMGGDDRSPVHEEGVKIDGAWIENDLDLEDCYCTAPLYFGNCKIDGDIIVVDATLQALFLSTTAINSLRGDRVNIASALHLLKGSISSGEVRLPGAKIGSNFSCGGARFEPKEGDALNCNGANIKGDVFLNENFLAIGKVSLSGTSIGSQLSCYTGRFKPKEGIALVCDDARVGRNLYFRDVGEITGVVSFSGAEVGHLSDDLKSWSLASNVYLDGFRYSQISEGPSDADSRINWLKMQPMKHLSDEFKPQPWEQLIKVFRDMGHEADARAVAIEKQRMLRAAGKITGIAYPLHRIYGLLAGYGYKPLNAVCAMFLVWAFSGHIFDYAEQRGLMGPASPAIQANKSINEACGDAAGTRETNWTRCKDLPQEYTTFNPYLYSLDLILPPVDLQQDSDWAPIVVKDDGVTRIGLGVIFRFVMWFEILFGWAMTLLIVAVLGNLVKKD